MFDDAFELLKRTGRPGAAAPFKTGPELVSSGCLPYREPEEVDDQALCSLAAPVCSQKPELEGRVTCLRCRCRGSPAGSAKSRALPRQLTWHCCTLIQRL
jgi:hypothetical protein